MLFTETNHPTTRPRTREETPQQLLERVALERAHIESLFLFTPRGKLMASAAKPVARDHRWQTIAHEVWQTTQKTCIDQADCGLKFIALQCSLGQVAASSLESGHTLAIIGRHHVRLGVLLYEVDGLAAALSKLLV